MRIGIQTWGSEGDVRPCLALGRALAASGHQVSLVATELDDRRYDAYADVPGLSMRMVASPTPDQLAGLEALGRVLLRKNAFEQGKLLTERLFRPAVPEMFDAARALCRGIDLLVVHFFHYPARAAAELAGVPAVSVTFSGDLIPSRTYPPTGVPSWGSVMHRAWWALGRALMRPAFLRPINDFRRSLGLPPYASMADAWHSPLLDLVAVSPTLMPPAPDWDRRHRVTGFLSLPATAAPESLPADVEAFLADGPAPIFVGFGSLSPKAGVFRDETRRIVEEAAARAGCRALVQGLAPEGERGCGAGNGDVLHVGRVPHLRVFPRCAAVVHHGGAGTTQTALLAQAPSVVVPHLGDQFAWAAVLHRRGVAARPLPRRRFGTAALAARLRAALAPAVKAEAVRLGTRMAGEDGCAEARRLLEAVASSGSPSSWTPAT
jgi:UDP:flavonoid glycosyltransferase YjiC (YdhE family)